MRSLISEKRVENAAFWAIIPGFFGLWGTGHLFTGRKLRGTFLLLLGFLFLGGYYTMITLESISKPDWFFFLSPGIFFVSLILPPLLPSFILYLASSMDEGSFALPIAMLIVIVGGLAYLWQCIDASKIQRWSKATKEQWGMTDISQFKMNPTAILLLALFPGIFGFWGIGHLYTRNNSRGIPLLILGIFSRFLFLTPYPIYVFFVIVFIAGWILQAWDAYKLVVKYNRALE